MFKFLNVDGVDGATGGVVRVACPRWALTRIVLPSDLTQISGDARGQRALGVAVERTRPQAVLRVQPRGRAGATLVDIRGSQLHLRLALETTEGTRDRTLTLAVPSAPPARPAQRAAPAHDVAPAITSRDLARTDVVALPPESKPASVPPSPVVEPLAPSPAPTMASPMPSPTPQAAVASTPTPTRDSAVAFDVRALLRASRVRLGRQEGLPGQRRMTLVEALHDESFVWLRFTLSDGASERVQAVGWERGPLSSFTQEAVGANLQVVVQLPRAPITRRTRVTLSMLSGSEYRFALSSGTLADLFRRPF